MGEGAARDRRLRESKIQAEMEVSGLNPHGPRRNGIPPLLEALMGSAGSRLDPSLYNDYIVPSSAGYGPGYHLGEKKFFEPRQLTGGPPGASYLDQAGNVLKFNEYFRPHTKLLTLPASPSRRLEHIMPPGTPFREYDASASEGVLSNNQLHQLFGFLLDEHPSNRGERPGAEDVPLILEGPSPGEDEELVLINEPTRGLDVGAKQEMFRRMGWDEINPYAPGYDEPSARDRRLRDSYEQAVREYDEEISREAIMPPGEYESIQEMMGKRRY